MISPRRQFIKYLLTFSGLGLFIKPLSALATWNVDAFSAEKENNALDEMFPGKTVTDSDAIFISVHEFIENGAVVPVKIETTLPAVESISVLVEKNPNPLIAHFKFTPECKGFIATRIKVAEPSDIIAVVQSKGDLFVTRKYVEVVEGGCG